MAALQLQGQPAAVSWPPAGAHYQFYPVASLEAADRQAAAYSQREDASYPFDARMRPESTPQSSGDTLALEPQPGIHAQAISRLSSGRALQADLLQLEEVVPWKAVTPRWRSQRSRWRRTLQSPHLPRATIARCMEEFHAALALRPGTGLQFCGQAWEVLLRSCTHSHAAGTDALHALVRDFQQGVHAWLGPHLEASPSSPSTPYLPVEDHDADQRPDALHDRQEAGAVEGVWGKGATPPPSPFSMPTQQQVDPALARQVREMMHQAEPFRDDSAKQAGGVRLRKLGDSKLHGTDSDETDLDDYD